MSYILNSPPSLCLIWIAPFSSPSVIILASKFVNPAAANAVTKSSESDIVESPGPPNVTVFAVSSAACPFIDSATTNVSAFTKLGLVFLDWIIVSPPSYLNVWKSPTLRVVSVSFTADCSVTLNCVYKVPSESPVPPLLGSKLKIAVWLFAYNGASTVEKLAELELYNFITMSAPELGVLVLNHNDPFGLLSSAVFQVGLLACVFCSKETPLYKPAVIPVTVKIVPELFSILIVFAPAAESP